MFENYPRFAECTIQTFDDNKRGKIKHLLDCLRTNKQTILR